MDVSWAGPPIDARPQFPLERAELIGLLSNLDAEDWRRATVCPGWTVHDIVAHVVHDYLRKLARTRDGYDPRGPRPGEEMPAFLHRVNQEFVDVASLLSPRVLIDLLDYLGPQLDRLWADLDLDRLGEAVSWAAPGVPAPTWLDVAREYSEFWVHQQQIRDAVGRPGANAENLTAPVIDAFLRAVPHALRDVPAERGSGLEVAVSGPGGGTWSAWLGETRWSISRGSAQETARTRVALSSDTLWRVATRGIGVDDARARATVTGNQALGTAALSLVSIIR
ncbi:MAG: maleylpyruvate isomerase family mycothiol-dependent enzyme [Streptosporangiaceae bacterium]